MNPRELDVVVAKEVFGIEIEGWADCRWYECSCCPTIYAIKEGLVDTTKHYPVYLDKASDCSCEYVAKRKQEYEEEYDEPYSLNNKIGNHYDMCLSVLPRYSTNLDGADILEKKIEELDTAHAIIEVYISSLRKQLNMCRDMMSSHYEIFKISRVTPEQKCLAALEAIRSVK